MRALHDLVSSTSSPKSKSKSATANIRLPITPEQPQMNWSSSESSSSTDTTPKYKPISPVCPTLQNLAFDVLAGETEQFSVNQHEHMDNVPLSPRISSLEHMLDETATSLEVQNIEDGDEGEVEGDGDEDSMEGVEFSETREEPPVLRESGDSEKSYEGDLSDCTLTQELLQGEDEDDVSRFELESQTEEPEELSEMKSNSLPRIEDGSHIQPDSRLNVTPIQSDSPVEEVSQKAYFVEQNASFPATGFPYEWLGTSQYSVESTINLHDEGKLDLLIFQRAQVLAESQKHPYDPTPLLTLAYLDNCLGFSDVAVSNCHRALLLINAAFNIKVPTIPTDLGSLAQKAISLRMNSTNITIVGDEMLALRLQAYTTMVTGLQGCTAFWDGLKQSKLALKLYPGDYKLLQLKAELEDGFEHRGKDLPKDMGLEGRSAVLKTGKVYQRPYPWLDPMLFKRSMKLVKEVNGNVAFQGNMQVRRAFFGPNAEKDSKIDVEEGEDVGSLGLFATRDIEKGELVMVDKTIISVSSHPPSSLEVCDACQACLLPPYVDPSEIIKPSCCKAVAYCSKMCWETAKAAYHPLLCGRDFNWLYQNVKTEGKHRPWRRWRPTCFLRIIAIIITSNSKLPAAQQVHPLAHPLVARMTAAYSPNTLRPNNLHDWQFLEEVTIPTKILALLGVNIFTSSFYSQETIQTIYWRCENNANQTKNHLKPNPEVNLFNINTNYLFYNHSCQPNVAWHGPPDDGRVMLDRGIEDEFLRPGESAVWCAAIKDIKKGEECKISYIGDPLGDGTTEQGRAHKRSLLTKWCENGCGCTICEEENATGAFKTLERVVNAVEVIDEELTDQDEELGGVDFD